MSCERIESLLDPRLDVYRSLKSQNGIRDAGLFIAEGPTVVERVLRSGFEVRSLLISDRKFAMFEQRLPQLVPIYRLRNELAEELIGFSFHGGVLASVVRRSAPPMNTWLPPTGPALIVAGDRIVDPENVGALIRIAAAFGAAGVVLSEDSADPFSRRVLRVSMGNVLFIPVVATNSLSGYLSSLQSDHEFEVCTTELDPAATPLSAFQFRPRTVLLFGNEYHGVSTGAKPGASRSLIIPMLNGTDSLNVAVSAGIFLHQFRTQWPVP